MKHGLYILSKDDVGKFESDWLNGKQLDLVTTSYTPGFHSVHGITWEPGVYGSAHRRSLTETFGDTGRTMIIAYEMAGEDQGNYAPPANGDFDDEYRGFAADLVSVGLEDAIIAPNAEFNLSWSKRYPSDPQNYRDAFARMVREMQSVSGANFSFVFAPASNRISIADRAWPVDSPYWPSGETPPSVAPSFYDDAPNYPDDITTLSTTELDAERERAWTDHHKPMLDMWLDFATQRGARMSLREWGVATNEWSNPAGGDNPLFVERVLQYAADNDFLFEAYWNAYSETGGTHRIYPDSGKLTEAGTAWREYVVNDGSTTVSEPTHTVGGYAQPQAGALDWHVPLNENFAAIEADIKYLQEQIEQLK